MWQLWLLMYYSSYSEETFLHPHWGETLPMRQLWLLMHFSWWSQKAHGKTQIRKFIWKVGIYQQNYKKKSLIIHWVKIYPGVNKESYTNTFSIFKKNNNAPAFFIECEITFCKFLSFHVQDLYPGWDLSKGPLHQCSAPHHTTIVASIPWPYHRDRLSITAVQPWTCLHLATITLPL